MTTATARPTTRTHWRLGRGYYAVLDGREVVRIEHAILGERPITDDGRPDYSVGLPILAVEVEHLHPEHHVGLGEFERIDDVTGRLVSIEPVDARARDIRKALKAAGVDLTDVRITSGKQRTWVRVEGVSDDAVTRGAALYEILRTLWHDSARRVHLLDVTGSVVIDRGAAFHTFPLSAIPVQPEAARLRQRRPVRDGLGG